MASSATNIDFRGINPSLNPSKIKFQAVFGVSNYVDIDYEEGSQRCEILTDVFDRYGSLIRGSVGKRFAR